MGRVAKARMGLGRVGRVLTGLRVIHGLVLTRVGKDRTPMTIGPVVVEVQASLVKDHTVLKIGPVVADQASPARALTARPLIPGVTMCGRLVMHG